MIDKNNQAGELDDMVIHHIKYKEIHGYDETVLMSRSEHKKLHHRLRKDGICNISAEELKKISNKARARTDDGKKKQKIYNEFHKEEISIYQKRYNEVKDKTLCAIKKKKYDEEHKEELKNYRDNKKKEKAAYDKEYYKSGNGALYRKTHRKELAEKQRIYMQKKKNGGV